jgi:hypothetical protein
MKIKSIHCIYFDDEMIQAILDGRKTQMRRPIMSQPNTADMRWNGKIWEKYYDYPKGHANMVHECIFQKNNLIYVQVPSSVDYKIGRITLEVTDVRVKRLHEITEDEAEAEGVNPRIYDVVKPGEPTAFSCETYIGAFSIFWDNRYKEGGLGWDKNPWVWVIDFKRVELGANPAQERTQHEQVT